MKLTRRSALIGAGAAVATGAVTAPLAIKAAGVKAALAGAPDAQILALAEEHDRTFAEWKKAGVRWSHAVRERLPPHLRDVSPFDTPDGLPSDLVWKAILKASNYPEVEVLRTKEHRLEERCHDLEGRLSQTKATTLQGVCAKFRAANESGHRVDYDLFDSAVADVKRLAGEG